MNKLRQEVKQWRETKRTGSMPRGARRSFVFTLHYSKTFQLPCDRSYTLVRGKNLDIGSPHSRNPRRVVMRHGVAWRGGRRRRSVRGCPSCSHAHTSGEGASLIKRSNSL